MALGIICGIFNAIALDLELWDMKSKLAII